jgi:hypothetical protein
MNVEYLLVTFRESRTVLVDDIAVGVTNHTLLLPPGGYEVTLSGDGYNPPSAPINLLGTSIMRPMVVPFA